MEHTFFAGLISGIAQTIVGHPFDTWKTRSQAGQLLELRKFAPIAYRGLLPPLVFNGIYNSYIFTSTHHLPLSNTSWFTKGAIGGFAGGLLCFPVEYLKIRKQCREVITKTVPIKNVILSTCLRESFGTGIYFQMFYVNGQEQLPPGGVFLWGGLSGWASWALSYPLDTCKTRFQLGQTQTWKETLKQKKLYAGFGSFSIRCFLINAVGWSCFDFFSK